MTPVATAKIVAARSEAEAARLDFMATFEALKDRLNPVRMARDAAADVRETGEEVARKGFAAVESNPTTTIALASSLGLLLARKPIARFIRGLFGSSAKPVRSTPPRPAPTNERI